jgi:hypothetical protein
VVQAVGLLLIFLTARGLGGAGHEPARLRGAHVSRETN